MAIPSISVGLDESVTPTYTLKLPRRFVIGREMQIPAQAQPLRIQERFWGDVRPRTVSSALLHRRGRCAGIHRRRKRLRAAGDGKGAARSCGSMVGAALF